MATALDTKPTPITNQHLVVSIKGKIVRSRRYNGSTYTTLITPAPDAYSRPSVVEVRSESRVGDVDQEVTVTAKVGGYERKAFMTTDKDTGEQKRVIPVDHTLDLVE